MLKNRDIFVKGRLYSLMEMFLKKGLVTSDSKYKDHNSKYIPNSNSSYGDVASHRIYKIDDPPHYIDT